MFRSVICGLLMPAGLAALWLISFPFLVQSEAAVPTQDLRLVYGNADLDCREGPAAGCVARPSPAAAQDSPPAVPSPKSRVRRTVDLLSDAELATIKREILPVDRQHWGDQAANCDSDTAPAISFSVVGIAEGSYTRPRTSQRAILYRFCITGHNFALNGIVVLENGDVAAHVVYEGGWDNCIAALPSFDGTGRSEILISTAGMNMGEFWYGLALIELSGNGVRKFGQAEGGIDYCAEAGAPEQAEDYTWFVRPGPVPVFYHETFTRGCATSSSQSIPHGTGKWVKSEALQQADLEKDKEYIRLK
jgi:hypothetical protein